MSGIANYGLFWSKNSVHWGSRGKNNQGHLRGYSDYKHEKYIGITDFRHQAGVYVLQSQNREIQYVGQVGRSDGRGLFARLKEHSNGKIGNRWTHFSWFGLYNVKQENGESVLDKNDKNTEITIQETLDQFEGILIQLIEPRLNSQSAKWKNIPQYYQYIEEYADISSEDKISEIYNLVKQLSQ